jgi:hypothetical protein
MQWLSSLLFASLLASSNGNLPLQTVQNQTQNQTVSQNIVEESERFEQTYPFNSNGKIEISNINGSITVEAWDKNEIKLEAVKYAESKEWLDEVKLKIDASQSVFSVETDYGSWQNRKGGNWGKNGGNIRVEFHLYVPKNAYLDEIETINGTVNVLNMQNFTKASAVNGEVRAVNLRGSAEISTVNGTTEAAFDNLQSTDKISLSTVNGRVNLTIPSDADATIKADTVNGGINNDFGLPVKKGQYVGRDLYGKLGNGDVKIKLSSVNGALSINRKKDGREIKSVVNLLPAKDKDVEDWESGNFGISNEKLNKDIAKASKDAGKQARIAITQAKLELEELDRSNREAELDEQRQAMIEAQQSLKEAQKAFEQAQKETEGSKAEREEAISDAKESLKEAQEEVKNAQKEFEKAQKEFSRSGFPLTMTAPVSPVSPVPPVAPAGIFDGNISFSIGNYDGGDFSYGNAMVEKTTDFAAVKGVPKITVEGIDSEVVVTSWDKAEVAYTITQVSKNKSDITFDVKKSDSEISIKAVDNRKPIERTGNLRGSYELKGNKVYVAYKIRIELTVPRNSDLKIIGSDGNVRIDGVSGDLEINNSDGKISVRDSKGKLRITNSDGNVRIIGFKGELDAKTSDGNFYLEGDFSRINAKSSDGNFVLTLPENTNADILANVEELETFGISATKKSDEHWQIGSGGAKFTFNVDDGSIKIRGLNQVKN